MYISEIGQIDLFNLAVRLLFHTHFRAQLTKPSALKSPASLTPQFAAMTGIEDEDLAMEGNFIESTNGRKQPWKDFIHEACQSEHTVPVLENDLYCNICGKMKDDKGNCGCTGFLTA